MSNVMFNTLYQQYHKLVMNKAIEIVDQLEDAEEVANDVFVKLHKNLSVIDLDDNVPGWLMIVTKNQSIDKIRARDRKKEDVIPDFALADVADPNVNIERDIVNNEYKVIVKESLDLLGNNRNIQAYRLCIIDGYDHHEAAEIMGCTYETIKVHIHRCRKRLFKIIKQRFKFTKEIKYETSERVAISN